MGNVFDKRRIRLEDIEKYAVEANRKPICDDDVLNVKILVHTCKSVDEFIERV